MFKVKHKETGEIRTVYAVNGLLFVFWDTEKEEWHYDLIINYALVED
jgi:hypothetical protein